MGAGEKKREKEQQRERDGCGREDTEGEVEGCEEKKWSLRKGSRGGETERMKSYFENLAEETAFGDGLIPKEKEKVQQWRGDW